MKFEKSLSNANQIKWQTIYSEASKEHLSAPSLKLVFSGNEYLTVGGRVLNLYPGHFLMLQSGTSYQRQINSAGGVTSFSINFSQAFVYDFVRSVRKTDAELLELPLDPGGSEALEFPLAIFPFRGDLKYTVMNLKRNLQAGLEDELLLNDYLFHCLFSYYKIYHSEVTGRFESLNFLHSRTRQEVLKRLLIAKDYIISNYQQKLNLEAISGVACMSKNHFLRAFKQAYHISPYQFLLQVRLERARYLLESLDYPVREVAAIVGFDCPSSFNQLFRATHQVTPARYRAARAAARRFCNEIETELNR